MWNVAGVRGSRSSVDGGAMLYIHHGYIYNGENTMRTVLLVLLLALPARAAGPPPRREGPPAAPRPGDRRPGPGRRDRRLPPRAEPRRPRAGAQEPGELRQDEGPAGVRPRRSHGRLPRRGRDPGRLLGQRGARPQVRPDAVAGEC